VLIAWPGLRQSSRTASRAARATVTPYISVNPYLQLDRVAVFQLPAIRY
jgi:hypothetical protein